MIRMKKKFKVQQLQHRKIAVCVPHRRPKHLLVKRQRSRHISHEKIHRECPHPPPIIIRGHKRLARPRHRQRLTSAPPPSSPKQSQKSFQSPQTRFAPSALPEPRKTIFPTPQKDTARVAGISPSHHSSAAISAP